MDKASKITDALRLPMAKEAETQVIGALLLDPALVQSSAQKLRPSDFVDPFHRTTFSMVTRMQQHGVPVDIVSIKQELSTADVFKDSSSSVAVYLTETGQAVTTVAHYGHYAKQVTEASLKRKLHDIGTTAAEDALNGLATSEILADLWASVDDLRRETDSSERFTAISAADLDSGDFALTWLVDWLLVQGQPCIMAGTKKSLKTSLLLALLLALAIGNEFLGKFMIRKARRVLFCSGESGMATLQETARRIAQAMGWKLADVPNFSITADLPRLDSLDDLAEFESFLERQEAEVVAIDPVYLCMGSDNSGNLFAQGAVLLGISQLCQRLGVTLILCHHTKRNTGRDTFDVPELEDIAWAGFQEFARQWLLVGRRERYDPGSGVHRLWLSVGGSAGHGGLWALDVEEGTAQTPDGRYWDVAIASATEAHEHAEQRKADAQEQTKVKLLETDKTGVCRALARHPDGMTSTSLCDHAGISRRRWPKVLAAMLDDGELIETEVYVSNHKTPTTGYKLPNTETA